MHKLLELTTLCYHNIEPWKYIVSLRLKKKFTLVPGFVGGMRKYFHFQWKKSGPIKLKLLSNEDIEWILIGKLFFSQK